MLMHFWKKGRRWGHWGVFLMLAWSLMACSTNVRYAPSVKRPVAQAPKKQNILTMDNPRIAKERKMYLSGSHVRISLQRGQAYLPYIQQKFRQHGIPLYLSYLPIVESGFDTEADSGVARGMWQFTEDTAEHYGLKVGLFRDERLDWKKSTDAAARYLAELGKRFNKDWNLALAAYNAGPSYIEQAIQAQNTANYWKLDFRKQETSDYVPRLIAAIQVAQSKHPDLLFPKSNPGIRTEEAQRIADRD